MYLLWLAVCAAVDCCQQALGLRPGQAHCMHFSCTAVHGRRASDVYVAGAGRCRCLPSRVGAGRYCCLPPQVGAVAAVSACCNAASCPPLAPICWICTALSLQPGTYSALGYAHHLKGDVDAAIEQYHKVRI